MYWPGMNSDIDNIVESFGICQRHPRQQQKEPLIPYPVPNRPWQDVATDLCEIHKKEYLILVDAYSSYPEVIPLTRQTTQAVVKGMKMTFAIHGIPDVVHIVIMVHATTVKNLLNFRKNGDLNMSQAVRYFHHQMAWWREQFRL